jgi:hypothetical protein
MMNPQRRQSMYEMIENAAKNQAADLAWVGNLFRKRLTELQQTEEKRQAWLKEQGDDVA